MAKLAMQAQLEPLTRETGLVLLDHWRPRSVEDGVRRIRDWVRRHMRFVNEPVEILHGGAWMLDRILNWGFVYGDCDDSAILSATVGMALGLPARFVAVKPPESWEYVHVFTEFRDPWGDWLMCDPASPIGPPGDWDGMVLEI